MARPGDEIAAGAGGYGRMRASHADREHAIGILKAAFMQGRLAKDEFDLRVEQTLASRTYAELTALIADLPTGPIAAKPPQAARTPARRPVGRPARVMSAATALYAGAWTCVLFLSAHQDGNLWTGPLILDGTFIYTGVLLICVAAILINWRGSRSGGQPPRRPGADGTAA
jgi:DUF1707 SHOCT-like domain